MHWIVEFVSFGPKNQKHPIFLWSFIFFHIFAPPRWHKGKPWMETIQIPSNTIQSCGWISNTGLVEAHTGPNYTNVVKRRLHEPSSWLKAIVMLVGPRPCTTQTLSLCCKCSLNESHMNSSSQNNIFSNFPWKEFAASGLERNITDLRDDEE